MDFKGGKLPFKEDGRDWKWADFRGVVKRALGTRKLTIWPPPWGHGNTYKDWGMLANGPDPTAPPAIRGTGAGCCVVSSAANETKISLTDSGIYKVEGAAALFNGTTTISDYSVTSGFDPTTGANDNGLEIRQFLSYRQKTGIVDTNGHRHKIGPFVLGDPGNVEHMLEMAFFFEACPIGLEIQQAQMDQFEKGETEGRAPVWRWVTGSQSLGGHCIPVVGRPGDGWWTGLSWRLRLLMNQLFISKACEEIWGYLTPERISRVTGKSYEHASPEALEEYLHRVAKAIK